MRDQARDYAIDCHNSTNHLYDGQPYEFHLEMVKNVAVEFKHLVPKEKLDVVYAACWCHDVMEDTRQTYNDVKKATNLEVAEIVYALTNEKGKNRKERANEKYYTGIRNTPYAVFVKLCDRIANAQYSLQKGGRMLELYRKEQPYFHQALSDPHHYYREMWDYLDALLGM